MTAPIELARAALDSAPDAMIVIDDEGVVRYANRQMSVLFGFPHEEIIGKRVEQLMPKRFREHHVEHRHSYMGNVRTRPMGGGRDLLGLRQDGTEFPVEISLSPVEYHERVLVAATIRDVSDRKRAQAELVVAREAAERARESADRANQGKSRFLATASHDLRQPLQTLSLLNGVLRRTLREPDANEALLQQDQAIGAMSRLLNALLDISKLESGAVKPDPTDFAVSALFEELRVEFGGLAASKGLTLNIVPSEDSVHSDRSLVEQILKNLLSNAIKYTRRGWVALRCVHEQPSSVRIDVLDTGIGIPADQLRYIYDEFYQVNVPTRSAREGYGLGLSIVQRLVNLLGLKLEVQSEVGKGSLFSLTLPVGHAVRGSVRKGTAPPLRIAPGPARILLVEDDASVRDATRMLLRGEGFQVTAVASSAEALAQAIKAPRPDVLITDYHLAEGETGMQVIAAVREALGVALPAVLVTGDTSTAVREFARDPNLRLASKPMKADELLGILRAVLDPQERCHPDGSPA